MITEVTKHLSEIQHIAERHGIRAVYLFGSYARNEATEDSDFDLLIELPGEYSLLDLSEIRLDFEEVLGRSVDVITEKALQSNRNQGFRDNVIKERIEIYDAEGLLHSRACV